MNASTDKRYTFYTIKCEDRFVFECTNILSDMLLNSTFDKKEYSKERNIVIEEAIRDKNDTELNLLDSLEKMIYHGSSYAYPIDDISYHKNNDLKYENVLKIYKEFYQPSRMILSIITHIHFDKLIKIINRTFFSKIKETIIPSCYINDIIIPQTEIRYNIQKQEGADATYIGIGFRTCNYSSEDNPILTLFKNILSGSLSSRLFMILREDNGLTYSSNISMNNYESTGDFIIYAESDNSKIIRNGSKKGVLPLLISLFNDLLKTGVTDSEILIAKGYIKGNELMDLEDTEQLALDNGIEYLFKKENIITTKQKYETITKKQINNVIKKYLKKSNMSVCLIGGTLPSKTSIMKECEKLL